MKKEVKCVNVMIPLAAGAAGAAFAAILTYNKKGTRELETVYVTALAVLAGVGVGMYYEMTKK